MPDTDPIHPPLEPAAVADAVHEAGPRWRVELLGRAGSTNAVALARISDGAGDGLVVVADHQDAGRGRLDRVWETPPGVALTFTVVVDPGVPASRWPAIPLLAGLAVRDGLRRASGCACMLKWPNDVLAGGRKLAGILVERVDSPTGRPLAAIGIGVNVRQARDELPVATATSLALETGRDLDRAVLLGAVLSSLAERLRAWSDAAGDPGALLPSYREACATIGQQVRVQLPGDPESTTGPTGLAGTAETVDDDGRLVVSNPDGRHRVGAGDVVHVRPS